MRNDEVCTTIMYNNTNVRIFLECNLCIIHVARNMFPRSRNLDDCLHLSLIFVLIAYSCIDSRLWKLGREELE